MPLKLEMKQGDRIIINGAVLEAASPHTKIVVHNQASILRGKEILTEEQAATPATRVYYALQSAYLFPEHAEEYLNQFWMFVDQYAEACPSASDIVDEVKDNAYEGKLYPALKASQKLILHQQGVLLSRPFSCLTLRQSAVIQRCECGQHQNNGREGFHQSPERLNPHGRSQDCGSCHVEQRYANSRNQTRSTGFSECDCNTN